MCNENFVTHASSVTRTYKVNNAPYMIHTMNVLVSTVLFARAYYSADSTLLNMLHALYVYHVQLLRKGVPCTQDVIT